MVRTLVSISLLFTIVCGLAGCGGGGQRTGQGDGNLIRLQAFGDPAELDAYKELIAAFEKENPDVRVEFIPVGKQKDHMAKLTTSFVGGQPPDLFLINFRRFGQFAEKEVLEPLGPRMAERGKLKESDLYEQTVEAFKYKDTLTCIPQNVSSLVIYYNRAMFQEAGVPLPTADWTWDDFLAAGKALTKDTNGDGKPDVYGLGFEPTLIRIAPFIWQDGGEIVDDLENPTRFALDDRDAYHAIQFIRSWYNEHRIVPSLVENKSEDHESRFARGGLAMIPHSRRFTATLRSVPDLDWDVAPLPQRKHKVTVLHSDAYCMAKESTSKDAAYRFIEFALGTTGAGIIAKSGRTVPTVKTIANSPVFLDPTQKPASAQVFLDSITSMRRTPNIGSWNEIETRADPIIEEWYFTEGSPKERLGQALNEATVGLFKGVTP